MRHDKDREDFLDNKIRAIKPIFKNFQDNNTNILRSELCKGRLRSLREKDTEENEIRETLLNQTITDPVDGSKTIRYRCFDPEASSKIKPVKAVERLLNQSTRQENLSKTAGPAGFGLKRTQTSIINNHEDGTTCASTSGRSNHLLEKIRRNQQNLAQTSYNQKMIQKEVVLNDTFNDYYDSTTSSIPASAVGNIKRSYAN